MFRPSECWGGGGSGTFDSMLGVISLGNSLENISPNMEILIFPKKGMAGMFWVFVMGKNKFTHKPWHLMDDEMM